MKTCIALTVFLLLLLLIYSSSYHSTPLSAGENVLEKIERTYDVEAGGRLTIVSEFGSVDIQTAEQDTVEVVVTKESKFRLLKAAEAVVEDFEVAFEHEGADVRIEGAFKQGYKYWQKQLNRLKIQFLVTVPQTYNVDVETAAGGVSVADLAGTVRAKTSGGSLKFGKIVGEVWGHTSGGNIELTSCSSPVDLKTSGGNIEVVDVGGDVRAHTSGGNLRFGAIAGSIWGKTSGGNIGVASCHGDAEVQTSGGSIRLQNVGGTLNAKTSGGSIHAAVVAQPHRECTLRTSGGSITVDLLSDVAVDIAAKTSGGNVSTDFAVESVLQGKPPKNRLEGTINGGGPLMTLRTSGGNIHLQKIAD